MNTNLQLFRKWIWMLLLPESHKLFWLMNWHIPMPPEAVMLKRYQDVQEILENGINVYTTLNVQHLESRSETVAQITGIIVRETLPDEIFENADEVELIDLTPR